MLESIFATLYEGMSASAWIGVAASFAWGVLSILLSPCHLASIPLIVGYITLQGKVSIKKTFLISLVFSIGILLTIAGIGIITAALGRLMGDVGVIGNYFVAAIFFVVGLYLLDILKFDWNVFGFKQTKSKGILTAFNLGLIFGIALGPCTFAYMAPVLGIVFQTAHVNYMLAITYLFAFGLGSCSVIVTFGTMTGKVQKYMNWNEKSKTIVWIKRTCGILVILAGIYLVLTTF